MFGIFYMMSVTLLPDIMRERDNPVLRLGIYPFRDRNIAGGRSGGSVSAEMW